MRIRAILAVVLSVAGGAFTSQAPELAQQYRQRLQGALEELQQVVATFDADASRNNMQREDALAVFESSPEPFLNDRSRSLRATMTRLEHLEHQSRRMDELPRPLRPLVMMADPDGRVFSGALRDFEPAVPLTTHGAVWTAGGVGLGFLLYRILSMPFRWRRAPARRRTA